MILPRPTLTGPAMASPCGKRWAVGGGGWFFDGGEMMSDDVMQRAADAALRTRMNNRRTGRLLTDAEYERCKRQPDWAQAVNFEVQALEAAAPILLAEKNAEIERLRAENGRLKKYLAAADEDISRLEGERDDAVEWPKWAYALLLIMDDWMDGDLFRSDDGVDLPQELQDWLGQYRVDMKAEAARAALAPTA